MFIEAVNDEFEYEIRGFRDKSEGSDGRRTYTLLDSRELCSPCLKNSRIQELGIEKISFQTYQLGEKKLFNVDFEVAVDGGKMVCLRFPNKMASVTDNVEIFEEIRKMASSVGAVGLESLANQAGILAAKPRPFPPDKDSAYFRCMDACDDIELEILKLLCYALCLKADDTPGS